MPTVYTPNTVRACMRMSQNGQQTCNVYHIDVGAEPEPADLNTIASTLVTWWDTFLQPLTNSQTSLVAVEVVDVSGPGDDGIVYTSGLPLLGAIVDNPMPNNVSVAIKLATGFTGRSRRGRKYFAGMSENQTAGNGQSITPALQIDLAGAFGQLINAISTAGYTWVVNSIVSGGVPRAVGLNTVITDIFVDAVIDSMRRRLPGRGL